MNKKSTEFFTLRFKKIAVVRLKTPCFERDRKAHGNGFIPGSKKMLIRFVQKSGLTGGVCATLLQ